MLIQLVFVIFLSLSVLAVFYATHVTITRFSDYIINGQSRAGRFISDHASIICNISVSRPPVRCRKFANRKLKSADTYALKKDLAAFDCVPDIETRLIVSRLRTLMSLFRATT